MNAPRVTAVASLMLALLAVPLGSFAGAQEETYFYISGHVLDRQKGTAVGGAIISLGSKTVVSFDDGYYNMSLTQGIYAVNITSPTYKTYTGVVDLTGNMTVDFELEKRAAASTCPVTGLVTAVPLAALGLAVAVERGHRRKRGDGLRAVG